MAEVHEYDGPELRHHLKKFEILHKTYEKVKEHFKGYYKLTLKLIKTLENCRKHESDQYNEASHFGNMLAVLYHLIDDDKYEGMAEKINKETRERFPKNMFAMMLQCLLCLDDCDISEANELLQRMKAIDDTVECGVIPRAEYAYMLVQFGPPYYSEAIEEYKIAIAGILDNGIEYCDKDRVTVIWCYDLLQTYNRLMNHGCIQAQIQSIKITPVQCFENICQLLPKVLGSGPMVHLLYQGKAYIELFDSYKKLRNRNANHVKKIMDENLKGISGLDIKKPESWLKEALELAPTDGHVLERLGRHYRTIASNLKDFKFAESLLLKCIQKYPTRHVACHQLALCYKSMWLKINGFREAELHHNPVRMGCQQKRYGSKKKGRNGENMYTQMSNISKPRSKNKKKTRKNNQSETADTLDDNATFSDVTGACGTSEPNASSYVDDDDDGICLSMDNTADEPVKEVSRTCSSDSGTVHTSGEVGTPQHESSCTVNDLTQQVQECTHKIDERTLPPNKPAAFGQMPKQFSKPDRFDTLRTSNPRKSPLTKQEYLEKAIEYIKQTNEIVERTNCRSVKTQDLQK